MTSMSANSILTVFEQCYGEKSDAKSHLYPNLRKALCFW